MRWAALAATAATLLAVAGLPGAARGEGADASGRETASGGEGAAAPRSFAPALDRLLLEIRQRQAALARRERELDARERSIEALEAEAERQLEEIRRIHAVVEERLAELDVQQGERVKRLAKLYSSMPPGRVAPLLESLETDLAARVLADMRHKDSAAVLALMSEDEALLLSRRLAFPLASAVEGAGDTRQ